MKAAIKQYLSAFQGMSVPVTSTFLSGVQFSHPHLAGHLVDAGSCSLASMITELLRKAPYNVNSELTTTFAMQGQCLDGGWTHC
jgi:hypothetical protein